MRKPIVYVNYAKWWLKPTFVGHLIGEGEGEISKRYIGRFIPGNSVIIDAGAHTGQDSIEMARLWPNATVHSFEPVPAVFAKLQKKARRYRNIRCHPLALADHEGETEMFISEGQDASSSLLQPKDVLSEHPEIAFNKSLRVRVTTIDRWAAENGVERIDFMWLDLQGCELKALQGAERLLACVSAVYTEINLKETYSGAVLYPELRTWLQGHGFRVERENIPWESQGNVLFVRAGGATT
jgi:FkbM family methyltransferase